MTSTQTQVSPKSQALGLAAFLAACFVAAGIGGFAVSGTADTYKSLQQPSWAPPSWLFGPVWTVLYVLIAVAGWLVWRTLPHTKVRRAALIAYGIQLVLNAIWTPLFFGAQLRGLALIDIAFLVGFLTVTIVLFAKVNRLAAILLAPYWAWTVFATALNASIWYLNV